MVTEVDWTDKEEDTDLQEEVALEIIIELIKNVENSSKIDFNIKK